LPEVVKTVLLVFEHFGVGIVGEIVLGEEGSADNILGGRRLA
jgi:hypothetical protein